MGVTVLVEKGEPGTDLSKNDRHLAKTPNTGGDEMKKVFVLVSVALLFILAGCIRLNPSIKVSLESANGEIPYFSICKYEISFLTKGISSLSFESDGELSTYSHVLGDKDFSLSIYADSEAKKLVVIGRDSKGRELARKQLELTGGGRDIEESAVETDGIYTSEIPLGFYSLPFIRGKSFQQRLLILLELEGKGGYLILAGYGWRWLEYLQWLTSGVPGPVKAEELDLPTTIAENRETGELFDVITGELVGENEPPVAEKVSGPEGEINQGSSTFTWTGDDPDGEIEKYEYRKDGGAWTSNGLNTNYTWNDYTEGAHTFEVRAQDNEGAYSNIIIWNFYCLVFIGETVKVEAGSFTMGDEFGDLWHVCRPVHQVMLTYDFYMGKYEVSFDEYDAFCEATGRSKPDDKGWGRGQRPVINVSWWDAIAYCNWVSEREGLPVAYRLLGETDEGQMLDANGNVTTDITQVVGCRLPTEAEWEYAARGGKHHSPYQYSGSDNVDDVAWYSGNSVNKSQEVGQKIPNALNIYDMSGNVWEWCSDWWYEYTETPKINPYNSTAGSNRMVRGGSWVHDAVFSRVASRGHADPSGTEIIIGFRIARTVP